MADTTISVGQDVGTGVSEISSANSGTASGTGIDVIIDNTCDKTTASRLCRDVADALLRDDVVVYTS